LIGYQIFMTKSGPWENRSNPTPASDLPAIRPDEMGWWIFIEIGTFLSQHPSPSAPMNMEIELNAGITPVSPLTYITEK